MLGKSCSESTLFYSCLVNCEEKPKMNIVFFTYVFC